MPNIEVSNAIYSRLQAMAVPFVDTPNSVIERLLDGAFSSPGPGKAPAHTPEKKEDRRTSGEMWEGSSTEREPVKEYENLDQDLTTSERAKNGQVRIKWNGHTISSIIRWMGTEGANTANADSWLRALGYEIHPTTINAQVTSGRLGAANPEKYGGCRGGFRGEVADLSADEISYLRSIRPAR